MHRCFYLLLRFCFAIYTSFSSLGYHLWKISVAFCKEFQQLQKPQTLEGIIQNSARALSFCCCGYFSLPLPVECRNIGFVSSSGLDANSTTVRSGWGSGVGWGYCFKFNSNPQPIDPEPTCLTPFPQWLTFTCTAAFSGSADAGGGAPPRRGGQRNGRQHDSAAAGLL